MKHAHWIFISGLLWFVVGLSLLNKGYNILLHHTSQHTMLMWQILALFVGYLKGRFIFSKTVTRLVNRIRSLSLPISLRKVYPPAYWIVLGSMGLLGFAFRYLPLEIRGFADVAIGSALFYGSLLYWQAAYKTKSTYDN